MSAKEIEEGTQILLDFKKLGAIAKMELDVLPVAEQIQFFYF